MVLKSYWNWKTFQRGRDDRSQWSTDKYVCCHLLTRNKNRNTPPMYRSVDERKTRPRCRYEQKSEKKKKPYRDSSSSFCPARLWRRYLLVGYGRSEFHVPVNGKPDAVRGAFRIRSRPFYRTQSYRTGRLSLGIYLKSRTQVSDDSCRKYT